MPSLSSETPISTKDATIKELDLFGEEFDASQFEWERVKSFGLLNKCLPPKQACHVTCGRLLGFARDRVNSFRAKVGAQLCVFKVGVTTNPIVRYKAYVAQGFNLMWLIAMSYSSIDLVHMLEAALIAEFHSVLGCKNHPGTGGDGALNRPNPPPGPYFVYVTGARADQPFWVGS